MFNTVFYLLLNMSITASVIGLFILILRLFKQIPRFGIYALWSVVFIRFSFPFEFSSKLSILNFVGRFIKKVVSVKTSLPIQKHFDLTAANAIGAAKSYFPITYKTSLLERGFSTAAVVWIFGALIATITVVVLYYLTGSELRKAEKFRDNILTSETVLSPRVHGIFKQQIIVPLKLLENEEEFRYVMMHESVHVKRHDNLMRFVAVLVACLHWFNPILWIFLKIFINDMELACDTKVLKQLSGMERKQYAQTLANLSNTEKVFMSAAFGKTNLKVRVINVMSYKKLNFVAVVSSVLFIIAIALVLITNPIK